MPLDRKELRRLRVQKDWNITQAAKHVGVVRQTYTVLENGTQDVMLATVEALADAFGVKPADLIRETK